MFLLACGIYVYFAAIPQKVVAPARDTPAPAKPAEPVSLSSRALFMGDIYWGRYINDWSMASPLKTAYPFSRLNEFQRDTYDAWVANLECPTVADFKQTSAQEDATLSFNCSPDYLAEAAKWFSIVSLANNHTDNRGAAGFAETKEHLTEHGIQYFGHYDPAVLDDACEVVAFPVTVSYDVGEAQQQSLPVALCGFHGVFKVPPAGAIAQIHQYAELMPVIAMPHMGAEYQTAPDTLRRSLYHAMIDAGADMVLANHPHWVQSTEAYQGKLIVYSMGNFIFDQQANQEVTRSAAIEVVMNTTNTSPVLLAQWLALGKTCQTFKDHCLAEAQAQGLQRLPFEFAYGVVGSSSAQKITKPATEAEQARIVERLMWSHTMNQLRPPQSSL